MPKLAHPFRQAFQSIPLSSNSIRIIDPATGKCIAWTSRESAIRYVAEGRAKLSRSGHSIHFLPEDPRHLAALASKARYDRAVNGSAATARELRGIPFVGNINSLLGVGRNRRKKAVAA